MKSMNAICSMFQTIIQKLKTRRNKTHAGVDVGLGHYNVIRYENSGDLLAAPHVSTIG